ncbi:MAG: hypothetical protein KF777_18915 [Planctomycetaceae bacterium]|nr:hypothetical protein [Planctomycetaceae bacterium]
MRRKTVLVGVGFAVALMLVLLAWIGFSNRSTPAGLFEGTPEPTALPPPGPGQFLNSRPDLAYIGEERCASCHAEAAAGHRESAHARAFSETIAASEPAGGRVFDPNTHREYRVEKTDDQFVHEERLTDGLVLAQYPARYTIGSGRYSRSYLMEDGGNLFQSPATWFAELDGWGLSPGYEKQNPGFERPIVRECLHCHVGRIEAHPDRLQAFTFHTKSIDCERCHGPGELHDAKHSEKKPGVSSGELDDTIVNPARLSRELQEEICGQCHFHTGATIELRGRSLLDFRPGQQLADFCAHYGPETSDGKMRVVGHMEQMRQSACYIQTQTLTCTTCHDPHRPLEPERATVHYREVCLSCHEVAACGLPVDSMKRRDVSDSCMQCHMPQSETDLPHFAFTHHRIQIPGSKPDTPSERVVGLVPMSDVSHLPELDRQRCLGLAYVAMMSHAQSAEEASLFQERAAELLESVWRAGLKDADVAANLARLYWRRDAEKAAMYARAALDGQPQRAESRVTALFTLGSTLLETGKPHEARPWLEQLVESRRNSEDWFLLARCRKLLSDHAAAYEASRRAAELSPHVPQLEQMAADFARQAGDAAASEKHLQRARELLSVAVPARPPH